MKILHVVPTYIPAFRYGGPIESVHALNASLVAEGVDVTVYTTSIDGEKNMNVPLGVPVMKDGVKIFYFPPSFPRAWFYSRELHRALARTIAEFDLIHVTSVFLSVSCLVARLAKRFHKPYIVSPRGSLMKEPMERKSVKKKIYWELCEKKNMRDASGIFFTTPVEAREYKEQGFPLQKSFLVPNTINIQSMTPKERGAFRGVFNISPDAPLVLFLGRLHPIKGLDALIPAFADVATRDSRAVLVLAGPDEGGYQKKIEAEIEKRGIKNRVYFTGMLSGQEKFSALSACDIFILPSYSESFGMAAAEAMFFSKPVVVSTGVGLAESIAPTRAGLVVERTPDTLLKALEYLLKNPEEAKEMGARGKVLLEKEFFPNAVAKKCFRAYEEVQKNFQ